MDNIIKDYTAWAMAEDKSNLTRKGFHSIEEAEKYIQAHSSKPDCESCRAEWQIVETETLDWRDEILDIRSNPSIEAV
jgi:hypothetical protein